ncbi:CDF family Co(II)/Ni(II) efflux transporter DmeF [Thiocystis violacea]|uniref:CDF family Co(II)/Ni(II) efflux transporter DmeF n=1 Tax=Thiocystis violacea TaxID=13725 RepID=UPI001903138E|nr:CDF family Co(II)/Ni(II) efflux transporter DmeF [Thiocystis violacea]MBK1719691.1 cation transporter [Thiocystis violacea]
MHTQNPHPWQHDHVFGQDARRPGERKTLLVILITATMMVIEIATGIAFGSMALLADGLHMASHTAALGISAFAYFYARQHAHDPRYSFGTGKVNALAGFSGAILLAIFALLMAWESLARMVEPVRIAFDQAITVAILGLIVNGVSVVILGTRHHDHHHGDNEPGETSLTPGSESHDQDHHHGETSHLHHDHNLRSAYLHVLADALTSLLAIFALLTGKYLGLVWMDPLMGLVGAALVARWSWGLLESTSSVLLDRRGPEAMRSAIRDSIEKVGSDRVSDLHLWSIGPGIHAAIIAVVSHESLSPEDIKQRLPHHLALAHLTIEIHRCPEEQGAND